MSIHLSGPSDHSSAPRADYSVPAGRARSSTLGSGRPCPYLGSQDGQGLANNSPSRMNVCHAHPRKQWRGFRRVLIPYSRLTREKQAEVCFAAFNQCPYHQQASKEEGGRPAPTEAPPAAAASPSPAPRHKKHSRSRHSAAPMSRRKKTILQYAGLGAGAAVFAFIVSLVISAEPGRMFSFIFDYIVLQDIKAMGLANKDLDVPGAGGLPAGGNLKAMQNMSASQREKLKSSSQFKNLSEADKQKLKEKYKSMMGR